MPKGLNPLFHLSVGFLDSVGSRSVAMGMAIREAAFLAYFEIGLD